MTEPSSSTSPGRTPRLSELAAPAAATPDYLSALNEAQRAAVEALDGPVLVLAGAGTGKTRTLTTRLAHILRERRAWPSQILAVTFTNKAAREMHDRVAALVGAETEGLWLGTFHALSARMLRAHAELIGLKSNFTILDQDDQIRLVKQLMQAGGLDDKKWPPKVAHTIIERWKDKGLRPDQLDAADAGDFAGGQAVSLYAQYQERLRTLNAVDFGDLLLHCLTLFTQHPDVLEKYHGRFKYLLVDEYQDTNLAQYLWLRLLAQGSKNICCVGDDDQSIYGWRGAEIGNILKFEKDFPGARVVRLEENYRSTKPILTAASHLIAHNEGRLGKELWTGAEGGEKLRLRGVWDGEEEARTVADGIEDLQRKGHALDEIAILVRAGFQTREFEERFITLGIPYRVIGGPRFYERLEIRDAVAYLRVIQQPDDDLAFERIINKPRRGIGDASLQALHRLARARGVSLTRAAALILETDELKPQAKNAISRLLDAFAHWRIQADTSPPGELTGIVLDESGYTAMWQNDKAPDAPGRLENLKELVQAIEEFDTLAAFLEHISLVMEATGNTAGDMVNIMTLHSAKGLEFDAVFLPGWEEGVFPHQRALDEGGNAALEEERRLAYVGLTRARKRVFISFAANRRIHNLWQSSVPSRFIDELPAAEVEVTTAPGIYGGGSARMAAAGGFDDVAESDWHGGRRFQQRGAARGGRPYRRDGRVIEVPVVDGSARALDATPVGGRFKTGARVFHQKFGYGTVTHVDHDKLTVDFDHSGEKKVIESFVEEG